MLMPVSSLAWSSRWLATYSGAKTREQIYEAFEKIYPVLKQFKKGDVEVPVLPGVPTSDQPSVSACT